MALVTDRNGKFYCLDNAVLARAKAGAANVIDHQGQGYSVPASTLAASHVTEEMFAAIEADVMGQSAFDDTQLALLDQLAGDGDLNAASSVGFFRESFSAVRSSVWPD